MVSQKLGAVSRVGVDASSERNSTMKSQIDKLTKLILCRYFNAVFRIRMSWWRHLNFEIN